MTVKHSYRRVNETAAPESMTMDRVAEIDELVVAQTTQMCLRNGCCRPSINWVLLDSSNYELNLQNPFELPNVGGWIHEEATFFQRCLCHAPGCRETKFVHHSGTPPEALGSEDYHCCRIQSTPTSSFLATDELQSNIVAIHQKSNTCPTNCCCCPNFLPYLRTTNDEGRYLGETKYVCDGCIFVPKFLVLDKHQDPKFLLRPDTCWGGVCVRPKCGGRQGKCCRLPFMIRDPVTKIPLAATKTQDGEEVAQVTQLWSGLANEVCFKRHAYHIAFPTSTGDSMSNGSASLSSCSAEDKLVLIGSSILIDVAFFEQDDNDK